MSKLRLNCKAKSEVVDVTVSSLNSLAQVLREAKPLYDECHIIINNLAGDEEKLLAPSCATQQDRLPALGRGLQSEYDKQVPAHRVKNVPQHLPDKYPSAKPTTEPNSPKHSILQKPSDLTKADHINESCNKVEKAPVSEHTSSFNGPSDVEGRVNHSNFDQPEDGSESRTTGVARDSTIPSPYVGEPISEATAIIQELPRIPVSLMSRYDREELYQKVWTLTMQKVAREFGVSDVALGKTCKKLRIPVPGRGYWAKKAANVPVGPRPPLPQILAEN